ncbi:hypothetical protein BDQ12DRAFT_736218 [Crucibulum laeve]|uniref:DUF6535 domain-containing protein n=1 Tax=Crucibulum laeve TaxID=68775 RepID=A0A5C3M991_9AGAR|nr:hypothetical protein BDQ12DRAFT_736218 [Crucibulum laeve]
MLDNEKDTQNAPVTDDFIKPWRCQDPLKYPLLRTADPWEDAHKLADGFDKDMCDGWRDEVQNLLIFAGLFSAVVTGFTVESYKWLQEDPNDVLVQLLTQVAAQDRNSTISTTTTEFIPATSVITINILWFISLTLSLATVLIGIVSMQWLRSYQTSGNLPYKDALALRQMRYDGLVTWYVPRVINSIPLLLMSALILFFVGLLNLLWTLQPKVAIPVTVVIATIIAFLAITTVLPTLQCMLTSELHLRVVQCPFKSPQSWAFHRLSMFFLSVIHDVEMYMRESSWRPSTKRSILLRLSKLPHWLQYDLYWRQLRDATTIVGDGTVASQTDGHDLFRAVAWSANTSVQSLESICSIQHCLRDMNPRAASKVLDILYQRNAAKSSAADMFFQVIRNDDVYKDVVCAHILAYFVKENKQLYNDLLLYQTELYIRIRNSIQDPRIHALVLSVAYSDDELETLPDDIQLQFVLCAASQLSEGRARQDDLNTAWSIFSMHLNRSSKLTSVSRRVFLSLLTSLKHWVDHSPSSSSPRAYFLLTDIMVLYRDDMYNRMQEKLPGSLEILIPTVKRLTTVLKQLGFLDSDETNARWSLLINKIAEAELK